MLSVLLVLSGCGGSLDSGSGSAGGLTAGVAVDPYLVGAVFEEVAADGTTVLQRESTATDGQGRFSFPLGLTTGSYVQLKISQPGTHAGAPYGGMLRRVVEDDGSGKLVVSPLTTLLANGMTPAEVVQAFNDAGLTGLTEADLTADPMNGLSNLTSGVSNALLMPLQANMAANMLLQTAPGSIDHPVLTDGDVSLADLVSAVQSTVSAARYTDLAASVGADLGTAVTLGDLIQAAARTQNTMIEQVKTQVAAAGGTPLSSGAMSTIVSGCIAELSTHVRDFAQQRMNSGNSGGTTTPDGAALYGSNCAYCHGALASSGKTGATAAQIQSAISNNMGGMGSLSSLTADEVQAIADALNGGTTMPPTTARTGQQVYDAICAACHQVNGYDGSGTAPDLAAKGSLVAAKLATGHHSSGVLTEEIAGLANFLDRFPAVTGGGGTTTADGPTLYGSECAGCHGALATSAKAGATAAQIQGAIDSNLGGMGALNTLTAADVQLIADALAAVTPPSGGGTTTADGPTLYGNDCASCHGSLATSAKAGATAAQIQGAIDSNQGGMGALNTLTAADVQLIADALATVTPPSGGTGPDYSDCTACHGQPPNGSTFPNTAGSHPEHINLTGIDGNCANCHATAAHNGWVDLGFASTWDAKSGPATDNMDGTCSSISCHGGNQTPVWGSGTITVNTQCAACHSYGTTEYNSYYSGQHRRHVVSMGFACTVCHDTTKLAVGHFSNLATPTFEQSPASTIKSSIGYANGTCSTASCHGRESW